MAVVDKSPREFAVYSLEKAGMNERLEKLAAYKGIISSFIVECIADEDDRDMRTYLSVVYNIVSIKEHLSGGLYGTTNSANH